MTEDPRGWSQRKQRALIAIALSIAVGYVIVATLTDRIKLADALRQLGVSGCGMVLALSMLNYLLRFLRWRNFLSVMGHVLPVGRQLLYYFAGFAFTASPAKAGEAVRSLYLRRHGVALGDSVAAMFIERVLDVLAMAILASAMIRRPAYRALILLSITLAVAILIFCRSEFVPTWVERAAARVRGRYSLWLISLTRLLRASRKLLKPLPLFFALAIGLVAWSAEGLGLSFICEGLRIPGGTASFVGVYAIAVLAGSAAVFAPAGIGGTEVVMATLLASNGGPLHASVIATLLCRLATLWFAVIIGVAAVLTDEARKYVSSGAMA